LPFLGLPAVFAALLLVEALVEEFFATWFFLLLLGLLFFFISLCCWLHGIHIGWRVCSPFLSGWTAYSYPRVGWRCNHIWYSNNRGRAPWTAQLSHWLIGSVSIAPSGGRLLSCLRFRCHDWVWLRVQWSKMNWSLIRETRLIWNDKTCMDNAHQVRAFSSLHIVTTIIQGWSIIQLLLWHNNRLSRGTSHYVIQFWRKKKTPPITVRALEENRND
jgi:hypothetical protein